MGEWDIFHTETMAVERGLTVEAVRAGIKEGRIGADDLIRPAGTNEKWRRLGDVEALKARAKASAPPAPDTVKPKPAPASRPVAPERAKVKPAPVPPPPPVAPEREKAKAKPAPAPSPPPIEPAPPPRAPRVPSPPPVEAIPTAIVLDDLGEMHRLGTGADPALTRVVREDRAMDREIRAAMTSDDVPAAVLIDDMAEPPDEEFYDPLSEDQEAADFTLATRGDHGKEEDLDLAAMVDIAFQLIMFFMVTASTVYFKSVEIPPPNPDKGKTAQQAPSAARPLDELMQDNILVEVDPRGQIQVDHEPIPADMLITKMRAAREASGRISMLLMADLATPHRNAVMAYDAANEIGLEIKVGRPSASAE